MTALNQVTQDYDGLTTEFRIGDRRIHPRYGIIILIAKVYEADALSNRWRFTVEETGEDHYDYGDDWVRLIY